MTTYQFQGFGVARASYVLDHDSLTVTLPGPQLGKRLHEGRVPVAAITGFFVVRPFRYAGAKAQVAGAVVKAARANGGELVVGWRDGERSRSRSYSMVDVGDPGFEALVGELARLRPDADLRKLPIADARARLGMWSDRKKSLVAIAVIVAVLIVGMVVFGLTHRHP
jgi:hypothetical protein